MKCPFCNRSVRAYCEDCRCYVTDEHCEKCESQLVEVDPPPPIPGGPYFYCEVCAKDGPTDSQVEDMQWPPARPMLFTDKDDLGRGGLR